MAATFPQMVERWRPYVAANLPTWDTDFLLRWIQVESGGGSSGGWYTSLDERGPFQMHPSTRKDLGVSDDDWAFLLIRPANVAEYDFDRAVRINVPMLNYYRARVDDYAAKYQLRFSETDMLVMVKLMHALPSIPKYAIPAYVKANGESPSTWAELAAWIRSSKWTLGNYGISSIDHWLSNAEKVASYYSGLSIASIAALVALTVLVGII